MLAARYILNSNRQPRVSFVGKGAGGAVTAPRISVDVVCAGARPASAPTSSRSPEVLMPLSYIMMVMRFRTIFFVFVCGAALAAPPEWVKRSNEHARVLLEVDAKFGPEGAGRIGVEGVDEAISDLSPGVNE